MQWRCAHGEDSWTSTSPAQLYIYGGQLEIMVSDVTIRDL